MKRHPLFQTAWYAANILFLASVLLLIFAAWWEYSTRRYLKGFADAIVPLSSTSEQKVDAILAWMQHGPERRRTMSADSVALRDPQDTLNYRRLLAVCGTATNAFVNLAASSGLQARRLLLLRPDGQATHVVAEVRLADRWVVVDPALRVILRDAQGRPLTRQQLSDPDVFRQMRERVQGYPSEATFERTAHIRFWRVPVIGWLWRGAWDASPSGWEEAINWTLVLERESFALTLLVVLFICFSLASLFAVSWYGERRLGITRVHLREELIRMGATLFSNPR